jgi:hypothetical protein
MNTIKNLPLFVLVVSLVLCSEASPKTIYVNPDGTADFTNIQAAIADAGTVNGDKIEVAPGTYNEAINFLKKAVRLYSSGGAQVTIINGTGNYHVVQCVSGEGPGTILDGFTIRGGNANGGNHDDFGGGMYNDGSSPTVINCIFSGNSAGLGGGMFNNYSSPMVTNSTFSGNSASTHGGGMCNYSSSSPTVINCVFRGNSATSTGGGMNNNSSSPTVTNCTFSKNSASNGRGMYNYVDSEPVITNCIFWSGSPPVEIAKDATSSPQISYSDVWGGYPGIGNINSDPMFVNALDGDLRLTLGSMCIEDGNNSAVPANVTTDLAGKPRIVDGNFDGNAIVDMGAYEFQLPVRNMVQAGWYDTIQAAIDNAISGDQIEVSPGTYYETVDFLGKAIRLYSSGGPEVTIIDGTGNYHVVQCVNGEGRDTVLEGFTITGGDATDPAGWPDDCGGGMTTYYARPTVSQCIFRGNSATWGGGMNNLGGSPSVTNCIFKNNTAENGGGMDNWYNQPSVTNCIFVSNTGAANGGGMANYIAYPAVINCIFNSNTAGSGGGMYNDNSSPTVTNCTFSGNTAIFTGGGIYDFNSSSTVTSCILWGNTAQTDLQIHVYGNTVITYCDVQGGYGGLRDVVDVDPQFVDPNGLDGIRGTDDDNLRLSPSSPCIDAASSLWTIPAIDLDGKTRVVDIFSIPNTGAGSVKYLDMGAYEFQCNWSEGDINCDGVVNLGDFAVLADHWLQDRQAH